MKRNTDATQSKSREETGEAFKDAAKYATIERGKRKSKSLMKATRQGRTEPDLMEQTRATVTLLQSRRSEDERMYAFLSLFHPGLSHAQKLELSRDL